MLFVSWDSESISSELFELASEQRLDILQKLSKNKLNNSKLAEILDATKPEIHRNVSRLSKSGLIEKDTDGNYSLTTYGKAVLVQIPSITFFSDNKSYFSKHTLGNLDAKFIQRLGALTNKKNIKGYVKTLEKWRQIHENAKKYIYNILSEVPYSGDVVEVISKQLKNKIEIHSIFSDDVIIPEERKKIFEEKGFQKYIQSGNLKRKIKKDVDIAVLVTDKEAAVFFSDLEGTIDLSQMFYSADPKFREWCCDYFEWCWEQSVPFQEAKLS
ncbi:transcriptional regulator protein-like protein [Candidatus Nitrosopumilus koreensis AR1]|uniref:Transcriptional regulator protein-like protein n=1 Tax=Candidatus Nitrosopumilus koreensis AR1 TaxID=1229908 RepID=K0B9C5_9ARCH|nr:MULTISPECIES: ArsR family transcriptional regulator [Nitrosopumilus]AFS81051.1 transcriptional regulator protein-like protein [Candidatus Nitrosopumilus koreensis AR1]